MSKKGGTKTPKSKSHKAQLVVALLVIVILAALGVAGWWFFFGEEKLATILDSPKVNKDQKYYSNLTGLEISDNSINSAPTYCVQVPNGSTDGARPQVGLNSADVVFEAIAETGITRFAAIFQDFTNTQMIGPIRSLRQYYLEWDTPFDCTIVHDGGSQEALMAVGNGNYRNLDEDFTYMWSEDYIHGEYRYWNNVFTTPKLLQNFNNIHNYQTSNPQTFPRLKPEEVITVNDIDPRQNECQEDNEEYTTAEKPKVIADIRTSFTGLDDFTVDYHYSSVSNSYFRTYADGDKHMTYECPDSITSLPEDCTLAQVNPNVVVVMRVHEYTQSDGYHETIQTIGNGEAYIFQNGELIKGTWQKSSIESQIKFTDQDGEEIKFVPGQVWIAAVPQFGNVSWY